MRTSALTAIFAAATLLSACQAPLQTRDAGMATAAAQNGELLFADEFDSGTLDRSKWNVVGPDFWVNNEQQAYVDSPDTISFLPAGSVAGSDGGVLVLKPQFREGFKTPTGRTADFVSGRINTRDRFQFAYGRASARIKMPAAAGVWPAFWLLGNGAWPKTGEIDIMEYVGERDWIGVALHGDGYSGETPMVDKYFFPDHTDVTDWHEYSVDWSPDAILFKVDGHLAYRATRAMIEHYGNWSFDTPKFVILNFALGGAYPEKTNGIEKPYPGLPAETVRKIKAGEVEMYVDWVRVYARK